MRNRNVIISKIENLEGKMKVLRNIVREARPLEDYIKTIELSEDLIFELKDFIEREPRTPGELNIT